MRDEQKSVPAAPLKGEAGAAAIPLCAPEIKGREWEYVRECLDTGWVSSVGPFVGRFEKMVAERAGAAFGVATVSGTSALHIALLVGGVEAGDEVLVSSLTFIAPVNAIRYIGARPVLVDAEPDYWQMDAGRVREFLETRCVTEAGRLVNRRTGRRVGALLPVHILGHPCDMDPLLELARRYGLVVIEDATESLGATYRGRPVGGMGDIGCFSFNGNKIITTGGGGMIVTNRAAWAQRSRYLTTQAKDDEQEFVHNCVGFNYRLNNIQAAVGCAQMEQLSAYIARKREIAARYERELAGLPGVALPRAADWANSSWWLYTILVGRGGSRQISRGLIDSLRRRGIQTRPLWQPMHRSPAHRDCEILGGEVADQLNDCAVSLPCSVGLTDAEQERTIRAVGEALGGAPV